MPELILKSFILQTFHVHYTKYCFFQFSIPFFSCFFFPPEKHVLVSSSSGSDSEMEHSDRKHVHSDSEATEPKPAKMSKLTGVQKSISGFFSGAGSSSSTSHAAPNVSHGEKEKSMSLRSIQATQFNLDSVIEVYRFGHTKCHYKRHTIMSLSLLNQQLNDFKTPHANCMGLNKTPDEQI